MNTFEQGDRVVVNNELPLLEGETGTVRTPEYISCVMVTMDNEQLRNNAIGCFYPDELNPSIAQEG